jgi:hypothetical protein
LSVTVWTPDAPEVPTSDEAPAGHFTSPGVSRISPDCANAAVATAPDKTAVPITRRICDMKVPSGQILYSSYSYKLEVAWPRRKGRLNLE